LEKKYLLAGVIARSRLEKNDVLFSIAGAIGRTAIVTDR
jgi:hypothetical protein